MDPAERELQPFRPIKPDTDNTGGGRIQGYLGFDAKTLFSVQGIEGLLFSRPVQAIQGDAAARLIVKCGSRMSGENG
jgi:hypothetical protein